MVESYVAVDLEMTGLHAKTDRILEIGAVKVEKGKCSSVFHRMVDPKIKVPIQITELTGITDEIRLQHRDGSRRVCGVCARVPIGWA